MLNFARKGFNPLGAKLATTKMEKKIPRGVKVRKRIGRMIPLRLREKRGG